MSYNETAYKASQKYKAGNIKRVPLDMQKSAYETVQAHAAARSESVNGFIKRAISETMQRDTAVVSPTDAVSASAYAVDIRAPGAPQDVAQPVSAPAGIPLERWEQVKAHTEARREPVSDFLIRAIDETIERDKNAPAASPGESKGDADGT